MGVRDRGGRDRGVAGGGAGREIAVTIERAPGNATGGQVAAPVAKQVLEALLR